MPKLQEYNAPQRELKPDNQGIQAWETAGRRVGVMFREAGQSMVAEAKARAAILADKSQWPFTLFDLKQKFAVKPSTTGGAGTSFRVGASRGGGFADQQFAPRIMPNLYAANLASQEQYDNPLAKSLSPYGAHQQFLADEAARLSNTLKGLVGSGDPTKGMTGPGPNADAQASADAWARSISGVPVPTGYSPTTTDGDYGGGGDPGIPSYQTAGGYNINGVPSAGPSDTPTAPMPDFSAAVP